MGDRHVSDVHDLDAAVLVLHEGPHVVASPTVMTTLGATVMTTWPFL